MKKVTIGTDVRIYESREELPSDDLILMEKATEALGKSHSPYSRFRVGASVLLDNGEILSGANQENASYPLCLCAEMVVFSAVSSQFPNTTIKKVAITVKNEKLHINMPVSPCGACRQTMFEFENRQGSPIEVLLMGETGAVYILDSVKSLLPLSFDGSLL